MKLTADVFENIVSSLTSDSMVGRSFEKRSSPRVGLRMRLDIAKLVDGIAQASVSVRIRDISVEGIGLIHTEALPVGSHFVAQLPRGKNEVLSVNYRVVQCRSLATGLFQIGAVMERTSTSSPADHRQGILPGKTPGEN